MNIRFKYRRALILTGLMILMSLVGCKKNVFLDASPNPKLVVPKTLEDFRLLLDNPNIMNGFGVGLCPGLGEISSDNFYYNEDLFISNGLLLPIYKEIYTWGDGIFLDPQQKPEDWGFPYRCIEYANVILEGLEKINPSASQLTEYNNIKGGALFFRAHMYYQLMQIFAPVYDRNLAKEQNGVPLRLSADISRKYERSKVQDVYDQILTDLTEATVLLPDKPIVNRRPSKGAVFGLLARIYLSMQDYSKSLDNSNKCLSLNNELLDYNTISASKFFPFERFNKEIIFYSSMTSQYLEQLTETYFSRVENKLYESYSLNDLRKKLFFKDAASNFGITDDSGFFFCGSYDGTILLFSGIATDEIYLTRAECYARAGNISAAMDDLNTLMRKRWDNKVPYPTFTAASKEDALNQILTERRKELISRGLRWTDLRRLNKEGANITITRTYSDKTYTLSPNSLRYTFLIPNDVINFNPGMPQNPR